MNHRTIQLLGVLLAGTLFTATGCPDDSAPANSRPWADAGDDISTSVALETVLDGSASYDPDERDPLDPDKDTVLSYHWSFESVPEGSAVTADGIAPNGDADAVQPTFVADKQGLYVVRLYVNDGALDSQSDFVHVMADIEGSLPVADAGDDQQVTEGETVDLDGSASTDPLGNELSYAWYMVSAPDTSEVTTDDIADAEQMSASFVPDAPGTFLLGLQVNNGTTDSIPDFVSVTASSTNACPDADGGATSDLHTCSDISVSASASSDPDGDALSYSWRHLLPPFGSALTETSFDDPTAEETAFFADVPGTYTLQVSVNDGECESTPYQFDLVVTVRPTNTAPIPDATGQAWYSGFAECTGQWCQECEPLEIEVDGSGSTDPDGDPLTFQWENIYDPAVYPNYKPATMLDDTSAVMRARLEDATTVNNGAVQHQYEFQLTVTDCMGESATLPDTFGLVYQCTGQPAP